MTIDSTSASAIPPARAGIAPPPRPSREQAVIIAERTREARAHFALREFTRRQDGMRHAMEGGLWLHFHVWKGHPMAHLVSTNRELLLAYGAFVGIPADRLQDKPLKDPATGQRRPAWHWDLGGPYLPTRAAEAARQP